ncbi:glycosyltransferase 87 family protein [Longimycelium tulufanense]|uniref:glycosyltransferase 87 family protein n=1 Tax=Longimycelium tulufanense TaxID=907463 RepID=UPI00166AD90E|nr:glycosyltransferase 87 family protein [Longimycelium tulufanense]
MTTRIPQVQQNNDGRKRLVSGLWLLAACASPLPLVLLWGLVSGGIGAVDLQVYRVGGEAWLRDIPLYAPGFPAPLHGPQLAFTYPPLAAVLFSVLALVPSSVALLLLTLAGFAALAATCVLAASRVGLRPGYGIGLAIAAVGLAFEPVRETLSFGQINLILMGLIALDCLLPRTRWPRGMLIGVAAAIKLTPAVFVLFFLPRRQWKPVLTAAATFVACGLLGWVLAPRDTVAYWFGALLDPSRIGGLAYTANQSLRGVLHRLGLPAGTETVAWLGTSLLVVAVTWFVVRGARGNGKDLAALIAVGATQLSISPVSWSHHWVWIAPAAVLLAGALWKYRDARLGWGVVVMLMFVLAPQWWMPRGGNHELDWSWWQHILGNVYVWSALAFLGVLAVRVARSAREARNPELDAETGVLLDEPEPVADACVQGAR